MKTRGKRTGADDEKPVDETEEKPVRKRAKKKVNHVSEETEDPPCKLYINIWQCNLGLKGPIPSIFSSSLYIINQRPMIHDN